MFVSKKISMLIAALSAAALSSAASAQFGNTAFTMQWIDSISQSQQTQSPIVQFENIEFNGQSHTFVVLLNQDQGRSGVGFRDMPQDNTGSARSGRNFHDIDARGFTSPKDDNLSIVPLPPAALAGLGLLAGIAGVRDLRRKQG